MKSNVGIGISLSDAEVVKVMDELEACVNCWQNDLMLVLNHVVAGTGGLTFASHKVAGGKHGKDFEEDLADMNALRSGIDVRVFVPASPAEASDVWSDLLKFFETFMKGPLQLVSPVSPPDVDLCAYEDLSVLLESCSSLISTSEKPAYHVMVHETLEAPTAAFWKASA